jgi:hypothetical protein
MLKLIKLCVYGLFAYFVYELVLGMTQEIEQAAQGAGQQKGGHSRGSSKDKSQMAQQGVPVRVEDSGGGVSTRRAGRGVVRR